MACSRQKVPHVLRVPVMEFTISLLVGWTDVSFVQDAQDAPLAKHVWQLIVLQNVLTVQVAYDEQL